MSSLWSRRVLPPLIDKVCGAADIAEQRARWIPQARGDVLEIGVGSGHNLPLYGAGARVTAIDVSPELLARARARAGATVELLEASAEQLPFDRARFDTVVSTFTLCSVGDVARALGEIRRVLRAGGELIVIEHGLAPRGFARRVQRALTPMWRHLAGGCRLDRDVIATLTAAGFDARGVRGDPDPSWLTYVSEGIAV